MKVAEYRDLIDASFEKEWSANEWLRSKMTKELAKQAYAWGFTDGWAARRSYPPLDPPTNDT